MSSNWLNTLVGLGLLFGGAEPVFGATYEDFIGNYRLAETVSGYCFPELRVSTPIFHSSRVDMIVGEYFFPRVNEGEWTYDDDFERGRSVSYTTDDNELIHKTEFFDKLRKGPGSYEYRVSLQQPERLLRLRAEYNGVMSGFINECVYQRIEMAPEDP